MDCRFRRQRYCFAANWQCSIWTVFIGISNNPANLHSREVKIVSYDLISFHAWHVLIDTKFLKHCFDVFVPSVSALLRAFIIIVDVHDSVVFVCSGNIAVTQKYRKIIQSLAYMRKKQYLCGEYVYNHKYIRKCDLWHGFCFSSWHFGWGTACAAPKNRR